MKIARSSVILCRFQVVEWVQGTWGSPRVHPEGGLDERFSGLRPQGSRSCATALFTRKILLVCASSPLKAPADVGFLFSQVLPALSLSCPCPCPSLGQCVVPSYRRCLCSLDVSSHRRTRRRTRTRTIPTPALPCPCQYPVE